jgi:hypothetical protein
MPGGAPACRGRRHLIRSSMSGHPYPFRLVRDLGFVSPGCPGAFGASRGCLSVWLPAWLPRPTRGGGLAVVFKSSRVSLSAAAPTWAFSVPGFCVIQDHPAHIPRRPRPQQNRLAAQRRPPRCRGLPASLVQRPGRRSSPPRNWPLSVPRRSIAQRRRRQGPCQRPETRATSGPARSAVELLRAISGAGDENRTRTISLGSLWRCCRLADPQACCPADCQRP